MDPSTLERSSQGKDPRTFEKKAREKKKDPSTLEGSSEGQGKLSSGGIPNALE